MPGQKEAYRLYSSDGHALIDLLQLPDEGPPEVRDLKLVDGIVCLTWSLAVCFLQYIIHPCVTFVCYSNSFGLNLDYTIWWTYLNLIAGYIQKSDIYKEITWASHWLFIEYIISDWKEGAVPTSVRRIEESLRNPAQSRTPVLQGTLIIIHPVSDRRIIFSYFCKTNMLQYQLSRQFRKDQNDLKSYRRSHDQRFIFAIIWFLVFNLKKLK